MQLKNLLVSASVWVMVAASPIPTPQTGSSQSPATIQANLQAAQGVILTIINDLAQGTSAAPAFAALKAGLTPLVTFECPPAKPVAAATSSNEAIQDLQEVQLELEIVSLAIQDADEAGAQGGVCSALNYFKAAGAFISA
jgi:hypothetical protein